MSLEQLGPEQQQFMMPRSDHDQGFPIFVKWVDFTKWLFSKTEKFPKTVRFTFSDRINNLVLDFTEELIEARYTKAKENTLRGANLKLEKLRILLRISYESKFLSHDAYKKAMYSINEVGKMLGGWIKQQQGMKR